MKIITAFLLFLCLANLAQARPWVEYNSENFTVYSDQKPKKVIEAINTFETFRLAALKYTGLDLRAENQKARIFLFASNSEFKKLAPKNSAGFYFNNWDGPRMVVSPGGSLMDKTAILFHEYFHYLLRERSRLFYPKWYDEGFAEVLSSAEVEETSVLIGKVPLVRAYDLGHKNGLSLPLEEILRPNPPKKGRSKIRKYWSEFYASSWLLVHYIQLGAFNEYPDYSKSVREYILALNEGEDPIAGFAKHFGKDLPTFTKEIEDYANGHFYGIRFALDKVKQTITQRELSRNEGLYLVADLAWTRGEEEFALDLLKKNKSNEIFADSNLALQAILENHKEDEKFIASARLKAELAIQHGVRDARASRDLAHYYNDVLIRSIKNEKWDQEAFEKSVKYGEQAISLDPSLISAYRFVWMAHDNNRDRISTLKTMVRAYNQAPEDISINFALGSYIAGGDAAREAIPFLQKVVRDAHHPELAETAQTIIDEITRVLDSEVKTQNSSQ